MDLLYLYSMTTQSSSQLMILLPSSALSPTQQSWAELALFSIKRAARQPTRLPDRSSTELAEILYGSSNRPNFKKYQSKKNNSPLPPPTNSKVKSKERHELREASRSLLYYILIIFVYLREAVKAN